MNETRKIPMLNKAIMVWSKVKDGVIKLYGDTVLIARYIEAIETSRVAIKNSVDGFLLHLTNPISVKTRNSGTSTVIMSQLPMFIIQGTNSDN